jgi:hypothetical protein
MQAVGLTANDDFLVQYNLTIDTSDVQKYIMKLNYNFSANGIKSFNHAFFDEYFDVRFSKIAGQSGFCYTFNMVEARKLFDLEM